MNTARYLKASIDGEIKTAEKDFKYYVFQVYYWADGWDQSWKNEISGDELREEYRKAERRQDKWMNKDYHYGKRPNTSFWNLENIVVKASGNFYDIKKIVERYCDERFEIVADVFYDKESEKTEFNILIDDLSIQFVDEDGRLLKFNGDGYRITR